MDKKIQEALELFSHFRAINEKTLEVFANTKTTNFIRDPLWRKYLRSSRMNAISEQRRMIDLFKEAEKDLPLGKYDAAVEACKALLAQPSWKESDDPTDAVTQVKKLRDAFEEAAQSSTDE